MIIPSLNPLRFIKPKDNSFMANNLYSEFVTKQGLSNRSYTNIFKDRCENIYYDDIIDGSYGFSDFNGWSPVDTSSVTVDSVALLEGINTYSLLNLTGTTQNLIIKLKSDYVGVVTVELNGVLTNSISNIFEIDEPIIVPVGSGSIHLTFNGTISLYGAAVVPVASDYKICDLDRVATLIDLCPKGAVYSLSSETTTDFLPTPSAGDEYSDIIRKYQININPAFTNHDTIRLVFNSGIIFDFNVYDSVFLNYITEGYDWISVSKVYGAGTLVDVEVANYELTGVKSLLAGVVTSVWNVIYQSERIDPNYWYQADGVSNNFINTEDANIEIVGVLRAKEQSNINSYRSYYKYLSAVGTAGTQLAFINTFPSYLKTGDNNDYTAQKLNYGANNSEIVKIKKKASIRLYATCCTFSVGDFVSEPFEIIDDKDFIDRLLTEIDYKDLEFTQGMALDVFSPSFCVDLVEEISNGNELDVFIEQERNTNLSNNQGQFRKLTTKYPIPNYLAEKLLKIFNFDTITINDINFNSTTDGTSFEKLGLYLYTFTVELRRSDYNYEVE